ncbi:MAG: MBL fold metallo-hydrolase [candidate division Zixibacteria bacterium]|jgi:ribonuclease BN (tRNA processing enzyme)|nr:MBL fold metallo-hydrolase [candidate division Zixibacteria bacterium]
MSAHTLTILGCAANRQVTGDDYNVTSGYLLKTGERLALFDCGGGVTGAFLRYGFDFTKVSDIFISHTHPDHVSDLPLFTQSIYLTKRTNRLNLFLPIDFVQPFEQYMRALYMYREVFPFDFTVTGYREGFVYSAGDFSVRAIGNSHLSRYRERLAKIGESSELLSHSFSITVGETRLFYSADLDTFAEIRSYLTGCTYVLIDSTHVDTDEVLAFVKDADLGALIFTHLGDDNEIARLREKIARSGLDRVLIAEPGLTLEL